VGKRDCLVHQYILRVWNTAWCMQGLQECLLNGCMNKELKCSLVSLGHSPSGQLVRAGLLCLLSSKDNGSV
jgi:hypothetical protein